MLKLVVLLVAALIVPAMTLAHEEAPKSAGKKPVAAKKNAQANQGGEQNRGQACRADVEKLCPGMQPPQVFKCLIEKHDQASPACQAAMARGRERLKGVHDACAADIEKFCKNASAEGGQLKKCMYSHATELSEKCRSAHERQ